jgi:hypothetical protein
MSNADFWNMVGALGQWAGALATTMAVIVALWANWASGRTRLRLQVESGTIRGRSTVTGLPREKCSHVVLTIVNHSQKPVKIVGVGFMEREGKQYAPTSWQAQLPSTLVEWDALTLTFELADLVAHLRESGDESAMLWAFATDATGKRHWARFQLMPSLGQPTQG